MTSFGKLLVYLNTFVAVVLFAWALSLYTNRVNWFDGKTEDGTAVPGQLTQLKAEVTKLNDQSKTLQGAYARDADLARKYELQRDFRRLALRNIMSDVNRVDDKVKFLDLKRPGITPLIVFKDDNSPEGAVIKGQDGKDLRGLGTLRKSFEDQIRETIRLQKAILVHRAKYKELSETILLDQVEVNRQKVFFNNLQDEQDFLNDALINWDEQLRILLVRKIQLGNRLDLGKGR